MQHVLIVCGGRNWNDVRMIRMKLAKKEIELPGLIVVEGGARGPDRIAGQWASAARARGVGWLRINAVWEEHHPDWCPGAWCSTKRSCLGAGARRNQQMLDYALLAEEQSVLAFKDDFDWSFKKGGTEDMVHRAQLAGVHGAVIEHTKLQQQLAL